MFYFVAALQSPFCGLLSMLCLGIHNTAAVVMSNIMLKKAELDKMSGIWRAKGFTWAGWNEPLKITRTDCYIVFSRKNWICKDLKGATLSSHTILWALLKSIL